MVSSMASSSNVLIDNYKLYDWVVTEKMGPIKISLIYHCLLPLYQNKKYIAKYDFFNGVNNHLNLVWSGNNLKPFLQIIFVKIAEKVF